MDLTQLVSKNQSIKIVPSTEDYLRSLGLNVDLDEQTRLWFQQFRTTWKTWKRSTAVENNLNILFSSVPDPYRLALLFSINNEDTKDCKPKSLPYFIMETLQKWSKINELLPDDSLKFPAFYIATQQRNQHFLMLVLKLYRVHSIKDRIIPVVKDIIRSDNCRQACHIVLALEIFDDISLEDLLFPLVLQDKVNMLDEYLTECPGQVKPLVLFLDSLLENPNSIADYVQRYIDKNNVSQIKYGRLNYKSLGKLVARLCSKFNLPIETCKNLSKNRTLRGLKYLIYQRYQEHNVSSCVWDDLVKDSLKLNEGSAKEFIDILVEYDKKEALKWAKYLNMTENELPLALKDLSLSEKLDHGDEEENWDTEVNPQAFYELPFSEDKIISIDTAEDFYDLIISKLVNCHVVGIDCEWKPSFGATQSQVAIIQIATTSNVYLIDSLTLNKQQYSSFWFTFYKSFLDNAEIIKLGFGLEQDLREMKTSIIGLNNIKIKGEGLLDLAILWKSLLESGLTLPGNSDTGGSSLSTLVQSCFGLLLEKSEQCSNWELRPLRNTQIKYAAVDAQVLMEIYYFLQKLSGEQGINFEEICNDVMLEGKKKGSRKLKPTEITQTIEYNHGRPPTNVKLFLEPKLSSLLTYLRYCGIDVAIISDTMLWYDVIKMAIDEERYIVLSKLKCTPTINYPQSSILDVGNGSIKDQLQKIFAKFQINLKQNKLLSRCTNCNSDQLQKLDTNAVKDLFKEPHQETNSQKLPVSYRRSNSDCEDDDYNNFLSDDSDCDDIGAPALPVQKITYRTNKGVEINVSDVNMLCETAKDAILCEACGKVFWEGDKSLIPVIDLVYSLTKLKVW